MKQTKTYNLLNKGTQIYRNKQETDRSGKESTETIRNGQKLK